MPDIPAAPALGAKNFKTHCIHGHSLDDAYLTTHYWAGKKRVMRICRPCQIERAAKQRQKSLANLVLDDPGSTPVTRVNMPGLGGRLRRARNMTRLSQKAVADCVGVSWWTVLHWEHSHGIPDNTLDRLCELYNRPLRWFLTLEDGDLSDEASEASPRADSETVARLCGMIAQAPAAYRPMIEKAVENLIDGVREWGNGGSNCGR